MENYKDENNQNNWTIIDGIRENEEEGEYETIRQRRNLEGLDYNHAFYISNPEIVIDNQFIVLKYLLGEEVDRRSFFVSLHSDKRCGDGAANNTITNEDYLKMTIECCNIEEQFIRGHYNGHFRLSLNVVLELLSSVRSSPIYHPGSLEDTSLPSSVKFCMNMAIFDKPINQRNLTMLNYRYTFVNIKLQNSSTYILPQSAMVQDVSENRARLTAGVVEITLFTVFAIVGCLYFCSRGGVETTTKVVGELAQSKNHTASMITFQNNSFNNNNDHSASNDGMNSKTSHSASSRTATTRRLSLFSTTSRSRSS